MKLIGLRFNYGQAAHDHFAEFPSCQDCGEKRIAVLTVHHIHGRKVDIFRTLCFNCHMLEHSSTPDFTYADHQKHLRKKELARQALEARTDEMVKLKKKGLSLRAIGRELKVCHVSVKIYLDRRGALK